MKHIKIILGLILFASVSTFAQSPRIKLNQITKDSLTGSVLISSPSDSGMVYSRDFYVAYGADTVLILYGDTLAATSGIISSVLSDGVTITGNGTIGNELKVDTATVISTIKGLVDTLTNRGYLTANQTITLSGDVTGSGTTAITATVVDDSHNHIISNVDFLQDSLDAKANDSDLANYVTLSGAETITGAKTFSSDLDINAKIALNNGDDNVVIGDGAGASLVSGQALGNILVGTSAGAAINSGDYNVANGYQALYSNTTGSQNIANGALSLFYNTTGFNNVANGYQALYSNTTGSNNAANGPLSLFYNTTGNNNAANGYQALYLNTTGSQNMANGAFALLNNTTADYNTANGYSALYSNTTGSQNMANGAFALYYNTTGFNNVANGYQALYSNTTGSNNLANGSISLYSLNSGSNNQAYGSDAGRYYGSGSSALTTANGSLFIGSNTRASANGNSNEIVIGTDVIGNGSNSVTIGNDGTIGTATSKVVLNGVGSTGGTNSALYITSGGELTTNSSDERLKTNINPLDSELSTLMNLNPVTYNYTNNLGKTTFGFIAQELAKYYPDLVFTNPISKYKGVHYHLFAPILTKAIQEQQAIIETQEQTITDLQRTIQSLITRIDNLENK